MSVALVPSRLVALDAARGAAMLFVCVSHFGSALRVLRPHLATVLARVGMVATPSFVILSGMMMGYLWSRSTDGGHRLRWKLIDRGLFLLLAGHLLITLPPLLLGHPQAEWLSVPVTDALGFAMLAGAGLSVCFSHRQFLPIGLGVYALAWFSYYLWNPKPYFLHVLNELLVGQASSPQVFGGVFPLLPLAGLYLCAVTLGAWMASAIATNLPAALRRVRAGCLAAIFSAVCLALAAHLLAPDSEVLHRFLSPLQKYPPGPVYVVFFGACGLIVTSLFLEAGYRWPGSRPLHVFAVVGRSSLFVFLAQYYVYYILYPHLGPEVARWWPVALLFSLTVLPVAAVFWSTFGLNRWLTLGIKPPRSRAAA